MKSTYVKRKQSPKQLYKWWGCNQDLIFPKQNVLGLFLIISKCYLNRDLNETRFVLSSHLTHVYRFQQWYSHLTYSNTGLDKIASAVGKIFSKSPNTYFSNRSLHYLTKSFCTIIYILNYLFVSADIFIIFCLNQPYSQPGTGITISKFYRPLRHQVNCFSLYNKDQL